MITNTKEQTNKFFSYIRVSTKRQEKGASLDEQLRQINDYVEAKKFKIVKEFRETGSASKMGRKQFEQMTKELGKRKDIQGVIFWCVDRSGRNPFDQARLYQLKESGYELHFAADKIDSTQHSQMSTIFIKWGIACFFSEELKLKTKMGIAGRLKEGKYPGRAPIGYLDKTEAIKIDPKRYANLRPGEKVIDPIRGPLVKKAFELYSTGEYSVKSLNNIITSKGFRNRGNKVINWKMLYKVLRSPFYHGTIVHNGEEFEGKFHKHLITKSLFDKVQLVIEGKANKIKKTHFYLFQGLVKCKTCNKIMRSVTAKGKYKYFYCNKQDCGYSNSVQQDEIEKLFINKLTAISFHDTEIEGFKAELKLMRSETFENKEAEKKAVEFEITKLETRLNNLLNDNFDGNLPEEIYKSKKSEYLNGIAELKEKRTALDSADGKIFNYLEELGKLLKSPLNIYNLGNPEQKRKFMKSMVENFIWNGSNLDLVWEKPFNLIAERPIFHNGRTS
ncbi:MAG: hypothetical protein A2925_04840 [Candidatus Yanofskybacteria bacterium RIFCSPLOWO2_01_FULL_44_22]|uniref:Resolvase/invertase-type recombinase catalytic domain-containing protein n=2 Tax=Candidatus Yanofskyibacteriota TaxID=1752733 RepID=A0A1F8GN13_9BACT|nr:MAG: hypothetical protein A2925_04840 [Candidatus Yanofskybacteria bacterium RIFCSPLOWO2_01_FULL_44_22]